MEHTQIELMVVTEVVAEAGQMQVRELSDLQLALVGGGVGEVTPH